MSTNQRLGLFFEKVWRPLLDWSLVVLAVAGLLLYRLFTLLPYPSAAESLSKLAASNLHNIEANPLFLPYKLVQYAFIATGHESLLYMRLVSVIFASVAAGMMFFVLKRWHTIRIALIGMFLFVSSSWFLTYARTATPTIMYVSLITVLAYGAWARKTKKATTALLLGSLIAATLIYIPGLIWFVLGAAIWQRKQLAVYAKKTAQSVPIAIALFVILLIPLGVALVRHPDLIKLLFGLPANVTKHLPIDVAKNIGNILNQLLLHGPINAAGGVVGIALLDAFIIIMFILGIYAYMFRRKLDRAKMLGGILVIGTLLVGLGGFVNLLVLMPIIYIIAAAGIAFLLQQWLTVFPRNPLARTIGITLMVALVAITSFYHIKRYFVVWPRTVEARQVFRTPNSQ